VILDKDEIIIFPDLEHQPKDVLNTIRALAERAQSLPEILEISGLAELINDPYQKQKYIFEHVYNLAVFKESEEDRQQLRSVTNILRTGYANCTGYVTILSSVLLNLKIPFILRITSEDGEAYTHVYVVSDYFYPAVMDEVISQQQDGTDTFKNRRPALFDTEVNYLTKLDYPMITLLQGSRVYRNRVKTANMNGFWDTLFKPIFGDECNMNCNFKYASDEMNRRFCKEACGLGMTEAQYQAWLDAGGKIIPIPGAISPQINYPGTRKDNTGWYIAGGLVLAGGIYIAATTRKRK